MNSISYCIAVAFEYEKESFFRLINFLKENINLEEDEICVIIDITKDNKSFIDEINKIKEIKTFLFDFKYNWADLKNFKIKCAKKEYIFDLDSDELPSIDLLKIAKKVLSLKKDLYMIPRINTVFGLTEEYKQEFNYFPDERGYINFPDYQLRLFKNNKKIFWEGKVHETLKGYTNYVVLSPEPKISILHDKDIKKELNTISNIKNGVK